MPAATMVERNLMIYRHTWPLLLAEVFEPVLYLLSFGVGIGHLVGHVPGLPDPSTGYAEFVAPALLATAAMNGAMNETTFNMFGKLRTDRTYESILTTPMTVRDVALGEVAWALLRGTLVTAGFLVVVTALGLVHSPWALLVVPGALLIGFAFAAVGLAVVTFLRDWQDFQFIQLAMLPMFLFATTFYPLDVYPRPLRVVVECLPLYQSVELLRGPFLGEAGTGLIVPVLYLLALGGLGLAVAARRLEGILRT
ncbi:ABC transporter permease [Streptomyces liangshanensis]|uniref:Transport permease protein n=1 Tax=Streptomyces liangshanensis TaxID=2717324 RepID=A0A6G9GW14_9ACTN|nr:ABC transporter permease [Streptomyces liangshanensis]QIQ02266.1 ABC transporter permease [Streptomyces liangshanensis]